MNGQKQTHTLTLIYNTKNSLHLRDKKTLRVSDTQIKPFINTGRQSKNNYLFFQADHQHIFLIVDKDKNPKKQQYVN